MGNNSTWLAKTVSRYSGSPGNAHTSSRSRSRSRSPSRSKLPRWKTPSPMVASMIPPPIVASFYMKPQSSDPSVNHANPQMDDELSFFHTKQKQLEVDLQILLDAQAEALLSGLEVNPASTDDSLSNGSSTPTASSSNIHNTRGHSSTMQRNSKIGLREARKALYTTMRRLVLLKDQELDFLAPELEQCDAFVSKLDEYQNKRLRLEQRTRQIHSGDEHNRAHQLRQKADDLQTPINELEVRLAQLKAQQKRLRKEAQGCENDLEANLASYTASLGILDQKTTLLLDRLQKEKTISDSSTPLTADQARRTLDTEKKQLMARRRNIDNEREALDQGAVVWEDVVKEVSNFERTLREDMAQHSTGDIRAVLSQLDQTIAQVRSKHNLAQAKDWKLLVAAIGAELEAFLKGKDVLKAALAASSDAVNDPLPSAEADQTNTENGSQSIFDDFRTPRGSYIRHDDDDGGEAIHDLDRAFEPKHGTAPSSDTDTEDDGPDPELLISHHDTDTE